jgi:hypothetical protein
MAEDLILDSILFVENKFDMNYLERLVVEYIEKSNSSEVLRDEQMHKLMTKEYPVKKFQVSSREDPPLTLGFTGRRFYIRECYHIYYDLIFAALITGEYEFLTVVGTPGTGKSLFYVYVVHRYRYEHPETTIVTASFSKQNKMRECWVYRPGEARKRCEGIPIIEGALYLYDGPPSIPPGSEKMVCFSCPNFVWLDTNLRDTRHTCLWFPPVDFGGIIGCQ